jgi:shikimate dehydrogenase
MVAINRNTQLCMSLSARPGNFGTRFHNFLYAELGLDFVYKAFTTTDLSGAIGGIRALGIRGCAISMPFKEDVIALVDSLDASAQAIQSVNTVVNAEGQLRVYNTDYGAIASLLVSHQVPTDLRFQVFGSGGMAKAVVAALRDGGFTDGVVVARNEPTGRALAEQYGFAWSAAAEQTQLVVNATPVGMTGGRDADALPAPVDVLDAATTVFDVVAVPSETPMIRRARDLGLSVITGTEVAALQAAEQFALYTGVRPTIVQIQQASQYARSET